MSRYVDLDGVTWDGTKITSKIQEVKTKIGYMQGITVGWLWGDNVPHIDLEEHDAKVRANAIDELVKSIEKNQTMQDNYFDAPRFEMSVDMTDILKIAEQLKEG